MSYCVNPRCQSPKNPDATEYCRACGSQFLLQNRYRPLRPIGEGGFGRTFLAQDEQTPLKSPCAIKQFSFPTQDPEGYRTAIRLFRQEALRLNELGQHSQIPQLLAYFEEGEYLYLVQEFVEGRTLLEELQAEGVLNEGQIWELLGELLPVLQFLHQRHIIHRDIKPANIMRRRSDGKLVLIDFGIAKAIADTTSIRTGTIVGSPEYMAPEQLRGKPTPASDLFSLGVTCIYLLTNVSPWDLYDTINDGWVWRDFLPSGKSVSDRLGRLLDRLLQSSLKNRYQSAEEVLQAITPPKLIPRPPAQTLKSAPLAPKPTVNPRNLLTRIFSRNRQWNQSDRLISATGIDYTKLQQFLATQKWKEADRETWAILCQALGKSTQQYIHPTELDQLPCEDLRTIDRLWVQQSGGRFGFSIQAQIYEATGRDYGKFCDRIGWLTYNPHNPYEGLKFTRTAPAGHLPSRVWVSGSKWWQHAEVMAEKLMKCQTDGLTTILNQKPKL